ncbi:3-dehydroquinate synthase [Bacteroidia bacterium]|nr:3-dehydroquinate synthase [Bacteroidia bacterium]
MQIDVQSKIKDYTLYFSTNFSFLEELSALTPKVVVIDKNVLACYNEILTKHFKADEVVVFDAVETNKTMNAVLQLCDTVMRYNAKKNMTLISFGGGITQDVTGFLSSILYRGINWVFIPTTLLAQADSCLGSKTSLNYKSFKNLLGSFYPPTKAYIDVAFTKTLTSTDFYSGLGEIVKLHLMGGSRNIESIIKTIDTIEKEKNNVEVLQPLVRNSLNIKYSYIKDDEFDSGKRNLLNYGHCLGHAVEVSSEYAIPHGIAVVIGMIFANIISVKRGLLAKETADSWYTNLLQKCLKCELKPEYFKKEQILSAMKMDKKRIGEGLPLIIIDNAFELHKLTDLTQEELFDGIDCILTKINKWGG